MATATLATAGFEREIISLFRPEVLVSLTLGPGACPATCLQISEHSLLPLIEALAVHVPANGAGLVIAGDTNGIAEIVQGNKHGVVVIGADLVLLGAQAVAGGHAATREAGLLGIDAQEALNLAVLAARGHP